MAGCLVNALEALGEEYARQPKSKARPLWSMSVSSLRALQKCWNCCRG